MEVCPACATPITSAYYTVGPRKYHTDCFRCQTCTAVLSTTFTERDGKLFCPDHSNLYSKCEGCGQLIMETAIVVGARRYHDRCFTCTTCSRPIGAAPFIVDASNHPHCRACRPAETKGMQCPCGRALEASAISALGLSWHPECFVCASCRTPLEGKEFASFEGRPYCRRDNLIARGMRCNGCNDVIDETQFTVADNAKYHARCFACARCRQPIQNGENFFSSGGKPMHSRCDTCARCDVPLLAGARYVDPSGTPDRSLCETCARTAPSTAGPAGSQQTVDASSSSSSRSIAVGTNPTHLLPAPAPAAAAGAHQSIASSVPLSTSASRTGSSTLLGSRSSLPPPRAPIGASTAATHSPALAPAHATHGLAAAYAPASTSASAATPHPASTSTSTTTIATNTSAARTAAAGPVGTAELPSVHRTGPAGSFPDIHAAPPAYAGPRPSVGFARTPAEINLFFDSWILSLELSRARLLAETVARVDEDGAIAWDATATANLAVLQQARDKCTSICGAIHAEAPAAAAPRATTAALCETRTTTALPTAAHAVSATALAFGSVAAGRGEVADVASRLAPHVDALRQAIEATRQIQHVAVLLTRSQLSSSTPTLTIDLQALEPGRK